MLAKRGAKLLDFGLASRPPSPERGDTQVATSSR